MPVTAIPGHHTQVMQQRLQQTIDHLREDIEKVDEPQFKAMFETSAEVLGGLAQGIQALRAAERKCRAPVNRTFHFALSRVSSALAGAIHAYWVTFIDPERA